MVKWAALQVYSKVSGSNISPKASHAEGLHGFPQPVHAKAYNDNRPSA
jgi:hypothetical protein